MTRALASHQCDPGLFCRTRRHMWAGFLVGSRPCSEGFLVFLPPQNATLPNLNAIGNQRATGLLVARLLIATLIKESQFIYSFIYKRNIFFYACVCLWGNH